MSTTAIVQHSAEFTVSAKTWLQIANIRFF